MQLLLLLHAQGLRPFAQERRDNLMFKPQVGL